MDGGLAGLFATDLAGQMWERNSSVWLRFPFTNPEGVLHDQLLLNVSYNDGFVAWLNDVEIARRNAPETIEWNSTATAQRTTGQSAVFETIDISPHLGLLRPGLNVLALHGLNRQVRDSNFLMQVELTARQGIARANSIGLLFSEFPSAGTAPFWCKLVNAGSTPLALDGYDLRDARGLVLPLDKHVLDPG